MTSPIDPTTAAAPPVAPLIAPLAGPDWCWQRAYGASCDPSLPPDDEFVAQAAAFVAAPDDRRRDRQHPETAAVARLWEQPAARRALETLALAAVPTARIAERLGVPESVVIWAERLFFDVRPHLSAVDWIECHVLAPLRRGEQWERLVELQAALWGGATAAELFLDGQAGALEGKLQRLSAQGVRLQKKFLVALEMPVTPANALARVRLHFELDNAEQRLELAKQRFAHACDQARAKHDRAQARLEAAEQRRRTAAVAKQYRAERAQLLAAERMGAAIAAARAADRRAAASPLAELRWHARAEVLSPPADPPVAIAPPAIAMPTARDARVPRRVRGKRRGQARPRKPRRQTAPAG